jgi:hypothetical protein
MVPVTWELTVRSIENEVDERDLRVLSKKKKKLMKEKGMVGN